MLTDDLARRFSPRAHLWIPGFRISNGPRSLSAPPFKCRPSFLGDDGDDAQQRRAQRWNFLEPREFQEPHAICVQVDVHCCPGARSPWCGTQAQMVLMHTVLNGPLYFARRRHDSVIAAALPIAFRRLHAVGLTRHARAQHRSANSQHTQANTVISCTISGPWATQDCGGARGSRHGQAGSARRDECMRWPKREKSGWQARQTRATAARARTPRHWLI